MDKFKLIFWLFLLTHRELSFVFCTSNPSEPEKKITPDEFPEHKSLLLATLTKSRQSRCVRCIENRDRYYDDRDRYSPATYGRTSEDKGSSNWYYPAPDRYEDQYRYYDRYDRYTPRGYDRYDGRDYERGYDYQRGGSSYDDRRDASYDRYDTRGYDRGYNYGAVDRDRYYDRVPSRPTEYDRYDRDYNDRSSYKYDFRNYRPFDETYRGQSGFDSSGRGYYFATDDDRRYLPRQDDRRPSPCGPRVLNCPYDNLGGRRGMYGGDTHVNSGPIHSGGGNPNVKGTSVISKQGDNSDMAEKDDMPGNENKERDRQQSSAYGGSRSPRPLAGSYLFDRENNAIANEAYNESAGKNEPNNAQNSNNSNNSSNNMGKK